MIPRIASGDFSQWTHHSNSLKEWTRSRIQGLTEYDHKRQLSAQRKMETAKAPQNKLK